MTHYIYMIYDKIVKAYELQCLKDNPTVLEESYRRGLTGLAAKEPDKLVNFKDRSIVLVGSFDDNDGKIGLIEPQLVVDLDNLLLNLEVPSYEKD